MTNNITSTMFVDDDEANAMQEKQKESSNPPPTTQNEPAPEVSLNGHNRVNLPSCGKFGYPTDIEFREITTGDEEVLATATVDTYARTLNGVLKSILLNCSYFDKLVTFDRDYLLIYIWGSTYDPKKKLQVTCKHCKTPDNEVVVDLTEVPIEDVRDDIITPAEMVLSKTNKPIRIRLNTVADEIMVEEFIAQRKDKMYRYEHLLMVASIDLGMPMPFESKIQWVRDNVRSVEMGYIKKYHQIYSFGFKTTLDHKCSVCQGVTPFGLPFQTEDILYPTVSDDIGKYIRPVSSS